ncbi:MAG: hypothetical protein ABW133_13325 [Polyangiaceae bacterium]
MEDDQWANWRFLLSSTAIELFEHYGVSLHDEAHWTPVLGQGEHVAGSVYFGGDRIQGALTVCATRELLGRATPVPPELPIPLSDFAREIANQILGGLKTKLIRHGVDFSYEFADPAGQAPTPPAGDARTLVLRSSGGEVALMFVVTSNVELAEAGDGFPQEVPQGPGGLILL